MSPRRVVFFANGPARLLMSCLIAEEVYPDHEERHLVLLEQYGYRYETLLPVAEELFTSIESLPVATRRYSHLDQAFHVYCGRFPLLREAVVAGSEVVLFGIRSPAQKYLLRRARAVGAEVRVWAEGLAIDRIFQPRRDEPGRKLLRRIFARAFEYQHTYEICYVFARDMYRDHPAYPRLRDMPPLLATEGAGRLTEHFRADLELGELAAYEEIFFGQPLSEGEGILDRREEEELLLEILGERPVLILPHPAELAGTGARGEARLGKYSVLPGARLYRGPVPNDLLLLCLRPRRTTTWASTIGLTYAANRPESANVFYPVDRRCHETLMRYRPFLPNVEIRDRFVDRGRL